MQAVSMGIRRRSFPEDILDYRKILLFEPSNYNMDLAKRRLATVRDIDFFPIGLSNTAGVLRFDQGNGSASSISDFGGEEIVVDTLDAAVIEPISFIKMDLEGWELPALEGARRHIRDNRPKLAIAAYLTIALPICAAYTDSLNHLGTTTGCTCDTTLRAGQKQYFSSCQLNPQGIFKYHRKLCTAPVVM